LQASQNVEEDFSESFSAFILDMKINNEVINKKIEFFKKNEFFKKIKSKFN
jgi:hypothetical protein